MAFPRYIKSWPFPILFLCLVALLGCGGANVTPSAGPAPAPTLTETPASTASETPAPVPQGHIDPSLSIDTDGSMRLSLDFADANKDTANNTWWWPVERKPFSGGATHNSYKDRLMARIYLPPLSKSPADLTGMARLRPVRPTG